MRPRLTVAAPEAERLADSGDGVGRDGGVSENAVRQVAVEDEEAGLFEAGADGEELRQDVLAVAPVFEHFAEPADLAFDASEAVEELLVVFQRDSGHGVFHC